MINPDDYFPIKISECTVDGRSLRIHGIPTVWYVLQKRPV